MSAPKNALQPNTVRKKRDVGGIVISVLFALVCVMYIMPIMFLFIFNSYSSGLSYYYFIATLITILQTWIIRKFVDDQKLLKQIELAKSKPVKKSKFQQRLEEMQRMQQQQQKRGKK